MQPQGHHEGRRAGGQEGRRAGGQVIAVYDSNPDLRLPEGLQQCAALDELVSTDAQVIVVATPDDFHLNPTLVALRAGKTVFIEKPAATDIQVIKELERLSHGYPGKVLFSEKYSFANPVLAALAHKKELGDFMCGTTLYMMGDCDRILGTGSWRASTAYNPAAGGLSHNFMTALLFLDSPITGVRATGSVLSYKDLKGRGYDTMEGTLKFANGKFLTWLVSLANRGLTTPFGVRTVVHTLQFENGSLGYGPLPTDDRLIVGEKSVSIEPEADRSSWPEYNIELYARMYSNLIESMKTGNPSLHSIEQGINVAKACTLAFTSAKRDSSWLKL